MAADETFARYLAKHCIAQDGYTEGAVAEAAALAEASDYILTYSDGLAFRITCIIDRDAHPDRRFELSPAVVKDVARACLAYTGTMNYSKMAVGIRIMEVGARPAADEDLKRLAQYRRPHLFSKADVSAWYICTGDSSVWCNRWANGLIHGRRRIEGLLRSPWLADELVSQAPAVFLEKRRFPLLTCAMLAVLALVFLCEQIFGVAPASGFLSPSVQTLGALGGLNSDWVLADREWYRVVAALALHGDALHLLFNGVALYLAGTVLEGLLGRACYFFLFILGALGGACASIALNPASVVSVGASGAIMGLLAALFVIGFRFPVGANRTQIQMTSLQMLIPSLLPMMTSPTGASIDYANHFGGAILGALAAGLLLATWRREEALPRFRPWALAISLAGMAALPWSALSVVRTYPIHAAGAALIPDERLPMTADEVVAKAVGLVEAFPRDPRSHWFMANLHLRKDDLASAEQELRRGLAEDRVLKVVFKPALEAEMRALLALVLKDKGQAAEARTMARPVCEMPQAETRLRDDLDKAGLCV